MPLSLDRRAFLIRSAALGCSAAASPLVTPISFAAAPWENRLVVIILRGAMDGLDALRPVGDPEFRVLRPDLMPGQRLGGIPLDGAYELHPALEPLAPLWAVKELGFVQATSTPYRDKRSHFDGQDILEAGLGELGTQEIGPIRDGWLNRMLQTLPGITAETTYAIGRTEMLLTAGDAPVSNWSPDSSLGISPATERLLQLVSHDDPLFRDSLEGALMLSGLLTAEGTGQEAMAMIEQVMAEGIPRSVSMEPDSAAARREARSLLRETSKRAASGGGYIALAHFAAEKLRGEARIATFSINGWDTHVAQERNMARPLRNLADVVVALKEALGRDWSRTGVIAMTEFGRTARMNGNGGTDHGTAGTMLLAGGALRGGRVYGDWPGLAEADLYARRDVMPTSDVRTHAAEIMQGLFGLDDAVLEGTVFPGLAMESRRGLVL